MSGKTVEELIADAQFGLAQQEVLKRAATLMLCANNPSLDPDSALTPELQNAHSLDEYRALAGGEDICS